MKTIALIGALVLCLAGGAAFAQPVMEVTGGNVVIPSEASRLGLGTSSPAQQVHLVAASLPSFKFESTGTGRIYNFNVNGAGQFTIARQGDGSPPAFKVISNSATNAVIIGGAIQATAFNVSSSRALKENFAALDGSDVLAKVAALPISQWNFSADRSQTQHIGPMAEDFHSAFGLGAADTHIAVNDMTGVALAAIQGLHSELQTKDQLIGDLLRRVEELERRLND